MNFFKKMANKAQNLVKNSSSQSTTQTNQFYKKVSTKTVKQKVEEYESAISDEGYQIVDQIDGLDRILVPQDEGLILMTVIKGFQTQETYSTLPQDLMDSCEIVRI